MDQVKIGKFIAKMRKNKKMTQQELADKLNVTDRAVSNWENGRRMPDVSFFKPLCEILEISVNELISGERISKDKIISSSNDVIIDTLNKNIENKKRFNNWLVILFFILVTLVVIIFLILAYYKSVYPSIDIYNFSISLSDEVSSLDKKFSYELDGKSYDVYYSGIDSALLCDFDNNCYEMKKSLDYNQTDIEKIKNYFKSQYSLSNIESYLLFDGGTTIYKSKKYSVILCNTIKGNKDIYFGDSEMLERLDGGYCGHSYNPIKKFIRTYHIVSSIEDENDEEFPFVTLKQYNGSKAVVKINNSNNIVVGKDYEFSFYTFENFEDNIENIFKYSVLLEVIETDKKGVEQINEVIYVNSE